jgi:non-lysosomal glucosylceramidase
MGAVYNPCRIYCLNDEGGLVICAWPEGAQKPVIPAPYSQETMNGFEYSAAIHMIMTGLVEEGMECIAAIRRRYDGERRNPWNEFECGSNYARSMAAYALLNAFSGFRFDMVEGRIGFDPVPAAGMEEGRFRCFWSLAPGWGEVEIGPGRAELRLLMGELPLRVIELGPAAGRAVRSVSLGGRTVACAQEGAELRLAEAITIPAGQSLVVEWGD